MKIPKEIKVGGHKIKVVFKELADSFGEYHHAEGVIYIHPNLPQTQKESTLVHEVLHVMNATIGATQTGHSLLDSLAEQMYQFLRDNKLLRG